MGLRLRLLIPRLSLGRGAINNPPSPVQVALLTLPTRPSSPSTSSAPAASTAVALAGSPTKHDVTFNLPRPIPPPKSCNAEIHPSSSSRQVTLPPLSIQSTNMGSSFSPSIQWPSQVVDLSMSVKNTDVVAVAHGGFSDIHQAWLDREGESQLVAVKLLRACTSQRFDIERSKKRLNREVYVWCRLDHKNIATLLGVSYHMWGRPSMIMPWYDNGSAKDFLKRKPDTDRVSLIRDIIEGLTYLHTFNPPIVHGDLKASNVMITDDGRGALSDFGLSQVIEELVGPTGNTTSTVAGTARWQAPEVILDNENNPISKLRRSSDIWSFACTASELLTDKIPYPSWKNVSQAILKGEKPFQMNDLPEEKPLLRNALWTIFERCWCFHANERPTAIKLKQKIDDLTQIKAN